MTKKIKRILVSFCILTACTMICTTILIIQHMTRAPIQIIEARLTPPYQTTGIVQSDYYYPVRYQPEFGQIQELLVKDGQSLSKESPLLTYYNPLKVPEINALSAITKQVTNTQQAYTSLHELVKLKTKLYTTIQTPVQGIVRLHEIVPTKKDAIILEIQSKTQSILLDLPENLYSKLGKNRTVKLEQKATHKLAQGHITTVLAPSNTSISNHQIPHYQVRIKLNKKYPIGTQFIVHLGEPKMILPSDILFHKNYVVIHKNGKYVKRIIDYDKMNKQLTIKSGIFAGEKIVRNPNETVLKIK
ncbi:hypothetical protein C7J88_08555 [Staphylococcus muscae]|uniref:YknX-like barrel-sandwich hybrid domain-containing protein n=3 Tax=Staphylococcus muscae TaxID=1294 RepID=A0A240BX15_9STAP|nr:hypothetical protein [Staphylococcus muscae]AVQ34209.1 hypothetical protein C7J88_08555 [Staphylococcus muscae]GGA85194.1 hypothetical protein GCM10007183_06730 [Staphylococcus muscae]SNV99466.1 Uncharacterised protein [Staphylococcus muscae]